MFEALREDIRFAHALRFPDREPTWMSTARVLLGSRGMLLIAAHRASQAIHRWRPSGPAAWAGRRAGRLAVFILGYLANVITKSDVRLESEFEPGVYVSPRGHVFLGARAIGAGTVIHDRVTIGWSVHHDRPPEIGANVWIGPHTVVAGNITVGDGVTILPGTVLTRSVPARALVKGNPGHVVRQGFDNAALRRTRATDPGPLIEQPGQG
jgi:serine acetyltransferase